MIIVDSANIKWRDREWCHMTSTVSEDELHNFACEIGLKKAWYQDMKYNPHYDATRSIKAKAIAKGAIEVTGRELITHCFKPSPLVAGRKAASNE